MAVLAGGCGLVFMVVDISFGELVLILGGVPCLIGIGLFYWGKNILKKENVDVEKDMSVWD